MKCVTCPKPDYRSPADLMKDYVHMHVHNDLRPHLFTTAPPGYAKSFGFPRGPPPTLLQAHSRKIARLLARHTSAWINGQRRLFRDITKIGPCPWSTEELRRP